MAIVGGGIVGLATAFAFAQRFPRLRVIVLEKEPRIAIHQTQHNSGVIHTGVYYQPGSHKARLCVEGAKRLIRFCAERSIPVATRGKVIVATDEHELPWLDELLRRGAANGVPGLEKIGPQRLREIEPHAAGLAAIHSPHTATVDFGEVARAIASAVQHRGIEIAVNAGLRAVLRASDGFILVTERGEIRTRYLINCAGLYADAVARLMGAHPQVRIIPFRGEHYLLRDERGHLVRGLIYPVPDPRFPFLGAHLTRRVDGQVEAGPNAVLAFAREGYHIGRVRFRELLDTLTYRGFWVMTRRYWRTGLDELYRSLVKQAFVRALQRLVPELRSQDLFKGGAGVRAQAVRPDGTLLDDFHIEESPRAIHVLNTPSPAATASLAIGEYIAITATASFDLADA